LDLYGVVEDPNSAPVAIAGIILGGIPLRSASAWGDAAKVRREMSQEVIGSIGDAVSQGLTKLKGTVRECS